MKKRLRPGEDLLRDIRKALLLMKLTFLLVLAGLLNASAKVNGQTAISLKVNDMEISRVLKSIEQQGNYRFLYNSRLGAIHEKVSVNLTNEPIDQALARILSGKDLTFKVLDNNLIVILSSTLQHQDITVTGLITGESGEGLPNVSIAVKGTTRGTTTDNNGNFTLTVPESATLVISFIGYQTQEVAVGNQTVINVKLVKSVSTMDQVIVIGYGTQRKVDVTGSVGQINGGEIAKQASPSPMSGLQGKMAGVQIVNTGEPGKAPDVKIRGLGTYSSSEKPLYVVDGVWLTDIDFLNPSDIATISILKDASSEAIYGVRGANGVVLITTKSGSKRGTTVNYNGSVGWQVANNIPDMANAHEYAIMFNELSRATGGTSFLDSSQFGKGTPWFDQELRNALITNHQISVGGGSQKSTYNLSVGYLDQQGILKTNDYQRYTISFKQDVEVSRFVHAGYTVIGTYAHSKNPPAGIWRDLYTAPSVLPVYFADGKTYGDPGYYGLGQSVSNPQVAIDYNNATSQDFHVNGNAYIDIKFLRHFVLHSSVGGIYEQNQDKNFTPIYNATSTQSSSHNTLTLTDISTRNWIIENTLTYTNTFGGDHRLTALIGQTAYRNFYGEVHSTAQDGSLSSDPNTWYLGLGSGNSASNVYDVTPSDAPPQTYPALERVSSYFARATYSYKDRYTVTGTIRSDASTKFTSAYGRAWLPSVGAAWVISNENFMDNQHIFDALKLKASWGQVGNSGVPVYVATQTTTTSGSVIYNNTGVISPSQSIASPVPPVLNWEKGEGYDAGVEATILNKRLDIEADYYIKNTLNFVFPLLFPASNGYTTTQLPENVGKLRNQGVELTLTWKEQANTNFFYSVSGNVSYNENKFVENTAGGNQKLYSGGAASTGGQLGTVTTVGDPIGEFYGYKVIGIFQSAADVANYVDKDGTLYQPTASPGDFKYAKTSNGGVGAINGNDRVVLGNPNPHFIYGINTYFQYRDFDASLDFTGVAGVQLYNANKGLRYGNENFTKDFYDHRWHGEGTSNSYPSVNLGGGQNYYINSWYVENGSYFRIRNIQIGYTIPSAALQHIGIEKLRVFINAQNPVIFTKYTGFSPELAGGIAPAGSPGNIGIDNNVYPISAIYNFGVNLTL